MLCRDGVYYFVRRIPVDMQHHYDKCRLYFSLRTQSKARAVRAAQSITQRLDDYWMGVRLQKLDIPKLSVIPDWTDRADDAPLLSEAVEFYLKLKGHGRSKTFFRGAHRTKEYVIKVLGDRPVSAYSSSDAGKFRDWLLDKGLTVVSTKRVFATIKSIINLTISEHGLNCTNSFSRTFMPDRDDVKQRKPIPIDQIKKVQQRCYELDDEPRWLLALISDTGLRLSEAVGLAISDIKLDTPTPHIIVQPHLVSMAGCLFIIRGNSVLCCWNMSVSFLVPRISVCFPLPVSLSNEPRLIISTQPSSTIKGRTDSIVVR